jgi:Helix-turn-helix domain of resolvase
VPIAGLARVAHDRLFGHIGHPGGLCERRDEALNHHSLLMRTHVIGLGGLAEFERDLIRARTGEGRARAVARGQKMGRPFKLTDHQDREAVKRRDQGETLADIARSYNVSPATISRLTA